MRVHQLIVPAALAVSTNAQLKGFNYGALNPDNSVAQYQNFVDYFNTAKNLVGTSGFNSARLYTMIQGGTPNSPISAIPAALATNTSLLLGLWASAGQENFNNELAALANAISQYGQDFADMVVGISVGSEDLYRNSVTGAQNNAGIGADPSVIVNYIGQTRAVIANTLLGSKPVGHVDTWNDFVNGTNSAVISAVDFLGMNAFPYFQTTVANSIDNGKATFFSAYDATVGVAQGKPVWVTETGWPLSGANSGQAVASVDNSRRYWSDVGCSLFGDVNTFYYTLFDGTPSPSFGIVGSKLSSTPAFDLSCPA